MSFFSYLPDLKTTKTELLPDADLKVKQTYIPGLNHLTVLSLYIKSSNEKYCLPLSGY